MRFCESCDLAMVRDTSSGSVVFRCRCGAEDPGAPEDARIVGADLGAAKTAESHRNLIHLAPLDRVCAQVRRDCPDCGRDYMTLVRVGEAEVVIFRCRCGRQEQGGLVTHDPLPL